MASILNAKLNLSAIPKEKIFEGKKGKYVDVTIVINDEPGQFGDSGPLYISQSKEERESKAAKVYLGNVKVAWTNGTNVEVPGKMPAPAFKPLPENQFNPEEHNDLPF